MAKGIYIGVNSLAKKIKNIYVGVDNVARKVKKAYVGVNNVARLVYNADSLPESNIMLYGTSKNFYLNNNKNYLLSTNSITKYSNGNVITENMQHSGKRVSPKGGYFYVDNNTGTSTTFNIYKINEGTTILFDTLTRSDFPESIIGDSSKGFKDFVFRNGCFSYDEKYFYITTQQTNTIYSPSYYYYFIYLSCFRVTNLGLEHVSTIQLNSYGGLYYSARHLYVAVAENANFLAVNYTYYAGNEDTTEVKKLYKIKINTDNSLQIAASRTDNNQTGTQSYDSNIRQSDVEISADGNWIVVFTNYGNDVITGYAYIHYAPNNSIELKGQPSISGFEGFKMSRNMVMGFYRNYNNPTSYLYIYVLNSNGTITNKTITFNAPTINYHILNFFKINEKLSRDGTTIVGYNANNAINYVYKIDHTNNTVTLSHTIPASSEYQFCALINE